MGAALDLRASGTRPMKLAALSAAAVLALGVTGCGRHPVNDVDSEVTTLGTAEVTAELVEIPQPFPPNDLYNYAYVLKYRVLKTHRGHVRVFFEHYRELPEEEQRLVRQERDRYEASVEEVIEAGIRAAEFRPVNVRLTTLALFGMCNWAYQWYRKGGSMRTREIGYEFWQVFLRGIETDGRDKPPVS